LDEFEEHPVEYFRTMILVRNCDENKQPLDKNIECAVLGEKTVENIVVDNLLDDMIDANIYLLRNKERIQTYRKEFDTKFVIVKDGDWKKHLDSIL
jgi:hypothetical protein